MDKGNTMCNIKLENFTHFALIATYYACLVHTLIYASRDFKISADYLWLNLIQKCQKKQPKSWLGTIWNE